jgi:small-conductance mechanosensitive channel
VSIGGRTWGDAILAEWACPLGVAAAAAVAAALACLIAVLMAGLGRLGRRRGLSVVLAADRLCRWPWIWTVTAVAVEVTVRSCPDVAEGWRRAITISVITTGCWLIRRLLAVGEQAMFARLRVDIEDNRRMRRARTTISVLRRVINAVVVLLGLGAALMTFPDLRTVGGSLLASAGLAGALAALAAQTTLGNVFAGLQLAFTDAVRIGDVVVVEGEWGLIEEVTLTYVVVHIWDERRLVLPTSYFTTTPFQNWTRHQAGLLGAVTLHLDYAAPLEPLRERAYEVIKASPLWDGKDWILQVVDTTETTMVVRVLASAADAQSSFDLRCEIREALLVFLRGHHPEALPVHRLVSVDPVVPETIVLPDDPTSGPVPAPRRAAHLAR